LANKEVHHELVLDGGLGRTIYFQRKFQVRPKTTGMWRFLDWLPGRKPLPLKFGSVTYSSKVLAETLGLKNLYISFSGYWPEKGAYNMTCDFKDLEAAATISKLKEDGVSSISVVSAGNTARAFAFLSSITNFEARIIVPENAIDQMWLPCVPGKKIILMSVEGLNYSETIKTSGIFLAEDAKPQAAAYNIARRDGIGTILLDAVTVIGHLPDHYFQPIGSGIGAVAAYEASERLIGDGRFGTNFPRLHLSQNEPFAPVHHAWSRGSKQIVTELDMPDADNAITSIMSYVLSNKSPLYSMKRGLYDCLMQTGGFTYGVTNEEALSASRLISEKEGIDFMPPVGVCVASLMQAIELGNVGRDDIILLNATGGGVKRLSAEYRIYPVLPTCKVSVEDLNKELY
jgi:cysteate synthase